MEFDFHMWNLIKGYMGDSRKLMAYSNREMSLFLKTRDIRHLQRANFCMELANKSLGTADLIIAEHLEGSL